MHGLDQSGEVDECRTIDFRRVLLHDHGECLKHTSIHHCLLGPGERVLDTDEEVILFDLFQCREALHEFEFRSVRFGHVVLRCPKGSKNRQICWAEDPHVGDEVGHDYSFGCADAHCRGGKERICAQGAVEHDAARKSNTMKYGYGQDILRSLTKCLWSCIIQTCI